jgi:hypothetical protein
VGGGRDPAHDRVRLTADERARFARLERSLDERSEDPAGGDGGSKLRAAARRRGAWVWARFVRLAPWLALAAALSTPFAITRSSWAGAVCAVAVVVALTVWLVSSWRGLRDRNAARRASSSARKTG